MEGIHFFSENWLSAFFSSVAFQTPRQKMKTLTLAFSVFCCAVSASAFDADYSVKRDCIRSYVKNSVPRGKCEEIMATVIDGMFQFDHEVWMNYSRNKSCFIPFLMKHKEIPSFYVEYLHKEYDQPGKSEELKSMVEKALKAIDSLCSVDMKSRGDFSYQILELKGEKDDMLSHCIYVYGVKHNMIDERIFNFRRKSDSENCKPFRETIEQIFSRKTDNGIGHFDTELDKCVHLKTQELESRNPNAIFTSIISHELSSKQQAVLRQKALVYSNSDYVFSLVCIKEIGESRKLKN